jgi:eukaryotic-like serine/threonine-protein kinase
MRACLGDETIALYLQDTLTGSAKAAFKKHLAECATCRSLVAAAVQSLGESADADTDEELDVVSWLRKELSPKYAVEEALGQGGMGTVVRAVHIELDRTVAIKVMHRELVFDQDAARRFAREARAQASLTSPQVACIYEIDRTSDGIPYIVMEHLTGQDLGSFAASPEAAIGFIVQATYALEEAHAAGIIHRDLKPANLFFTSDGRVKVLDFGLAKTLASASVKSETREGLLVGSPLYMAPEQIRGVRQFGPPTDIWGLGSTLYQLLAGRAPFFGGNVMLVCARIIADPPPPLEGFSPELAAIVSRCLEKDPTLRFPTVRVLRDALLEVMKKPLVELDPATIREDPEERPMSYNITAKMTKR